MCLDTPGGVDLTWATKCDVNPDLTHAGHNQYDQLRQTAFSTHFKNLNIRISI